MKTITANILVLIIIITSACKKTNDALLPPNNNEVNASVVLSSGTTVIINAKGTKAPMGLSGVFGAPGFVDGTSASNAAVYIEIYPSISSTGTFVYAQGFRCQYRTNVADPNTPIYQNNGINAGSITFTTVNNNYIEGNFNAVCRLNTDSVIISGTFKGDYLGH